MTRLVRLCFALLLILLGNAAMAAERMMPSPLSKSDVASLKKTAKDKGTVKVIVGFRVPFAAEGKLRAADATAQRADIARATASFRARFAGAILRKPGSFRTYQSIPFAAIEVTPEELNRLSRDPLVASIEINRVAKAQLVDSIPMIRADEAHRSGFSGAGQTVAVIDSGVDKTHPFLAGKVVAEACFSASGWCPGGAMDSTAPGSGMPYPEAPSMHGTHVAGIVAGADSTSTGVAPQAGLIAIRAESDFGFLTSDILAALEYVFSRRNDFPIAAVNMSIGTDEVAPGECGAAEPAVELAMANLRSAGIATIVASGNSHETRGVSYPACLPSAIAVGAVSTKDWGDCLGRPEYGPTARDKVSCFSNTGSKLALLAPGSPIRSSALTNLFETHGGTSAAAPHVAGAWAVLKERKPGASVNDILDALSVTGVLVTDYRTGQTAPRIDVKAALDILNTNSVALSYTRKGGGRGTVNFSPAGTRAQCTGSCAIGYVPGTSVTLTATPVEGSVFGGWSGACTGTASCTVTMNEARAVTAAFSIPTVPLTFRMTGTGRGHVEFGGTINAAPSSSRCDADCLENFDIGTHLAVFPNVAEGSVFGGWSGACEGQSICYAVMNEAKSLTAAFVRETGSEQTLTYEKTGPGIGYIVFQTIGTKLNCVENCTSKYSPGTVVTVTALAEFGVGLQGLVRRLHGTRL